VSVRDKSENIALPYMAVLGRLLKFGLRVKPVNFDVFLTPRTIYEKPYTTHQITFFCSMFPEN